MASRHPRIFKLLRSAPFTKYPRPCWYNEFGIDGDAAAKSLGPKLDVFSEHMSVRTGLQVADVETNMSFAMVARVQTQFSQRRIDSSFSDVERPFCEVRYTTGIYRFVEIGKTLSITYISTPINL
ncbi:hypothetical protein RHMOL_Rhmol06G0154300 [Rhododendron molle]|uniref:Uncharacterized protein n=2 Tax=Rhododendron molle TaxID=49168 RepID=A0ACC0NCR6_RHOML|nr:hypothetical protein RHMOL_Rhmol06G0154300 [Rhododendron molle]KAI8551046.1 hypothetical protein RHMOL_Rhmol06G0154300 [Rhododendron molle]